MTLRFPTGSSQNSQLPFDVPIIDDVLVEGEETILLEASTSAPGEVPQDAPGQPRTTIIIRDDDGRHCVLLLIMFTFVHFSVHCWSGV